MPSKANLLRTGLTFDDVVMAPAYSDIQPSDAQILTSLTAKMKLSLPVISSAMDTVTGAKMAIAMAQAGGLGVIHKNMDIDTQCRQISHVKRFESGMVHEPAFLYSDDTVASAQQLQQKKKISGLPVVDRESLEVAGIVTNRDLRFETRQTLPLNQVMVTRDKLVTVQTDYKKKDVIELMHSRKIERIVVVDRKFKLKGMLTMKDLLSVKANPNASKDKFGRLLGAAAVGVGDYERVAKLAEADLDCVVVDSAHGHSKQVIEMVKYITKQHGHLIVMAGNVATAEGAVALAKAGAKIIKVGIGPGSICTTRVITGVGVPQLTAILDVAQALKTAKLQGTVSVVADGGIRFSGDAAKALAAGADAVMVGSMLAGCDETPGEIELFQGRSYKLYRGMGSVAAMRDGSADRYSQSANSQSKKLVPEGIEGRVPHRGSVADVLFQMAGGIKSSMGYLGAENLEQLRKKVKFIRITDAGVKEAHVHDVQIVREAPNYQLHS